MIAIELDMSIVMIRHGKPTTSFCQWCSLNEFKDWLIAFNKGGVEPPSIRVDHLVKRVRESDIAFTSSLARSKQSALVLGLTSSKENEVFDEAHLPIVPVPIIKLPASLWVILFRIFWILGFANGRESFRASRARGRNAAHILITSAMLNQQVLLIGHGWSIRFIETELSRAGWTLKMRTGRKYWDVIEYECPRS